MNPNSHRKFEPDIIAYDKTSGKAVLIVEVKAISTPEVMTQELEQLKEYMKLAYTKFGLFVTPKETVVVKESESWSSNDEEDFETKTISNELLFGDDLAETEQQLENEIYFKMIDLIDEMKEGVSYKKSDLISRNLPFFLKDAKVVKQRFGK